MCNCKHNGPFTLLTNTAADRPPAAFYCELGCGFHLPFDPILAGNNRSAKWREVGVAYLDIPRYYRPGPKLSQSHN